MLNYQRVEHKFHQTHNEIIKNSICYLQEIKTPLMEI
jgi:hypothetical protein